MRDYRVYVRARYIYGLYICVSINGTCVSVVLRACVSVVFLPPPRLPADPAALQIPVLAARVRQVPGARGGLLHLPDRGMGIFFRLLFYWLFFLNKPTVGCKVWEL